MKDKILILGGGSWGTSLSILLAKNNKNVYLWVRDLEQLEQIKKNKENKKYLPDIKIPGNLTLINDYSEVIKEAKIIVLAIPSQNIRGLLNSIKHLLDSRKIIVNLSKGIERSTLKTISEVCKEIIPDNPYVVLSGPSHAEEVARDLPTTIVAASEERELSKYIQETFNSDTLRVYTNEDVKGVEIGGA